MGLSDEVKTRLRIIQQCVQDQTGVLWCFPDLIEWLLYPKTKEVERIFLMSYVELDKMKKEIEELKNEIKELEKLLGRKPDFQIDETYLTKDSVSVTK